MTKPPRVFRSAEDRRAEIVAAAFACLQDGGHARLTARRIAARSGIALGHISYHFNDMHEILVETYRHASRLLLEATEGRLRAAPPDPVAQLENYLRAGFAGGILSDAYLRVRIDLWSAARWHADVAAVERDLYDRYRASLRRLIEAAGAAAPDAAADAIMAILDGLWLDWTRRRDAAAIEHGLAACLALVRPA